jgi:hypothetical protein
MVGLFFVDEMIVFKGLGLGLVPDLNIVRIR